VGEASQSWDVILRLSIAWLTVGVFLLWGDDQLFDHGSVIRLAALFLWFFAIILWCAFGVIEKADYLAEFLREPLGTLVLTLSIVIIEVVLIGAVALGGKALPTLGRDTMFAVLMIVLNGVVGLSLLLEGVCHHEQSYNLPAPRPTWPSSFRFRLSRLSFQTSRMQFRPAA
jgi:Ca2+:H+ antiporter